MSIKILLEKLKNLELPKNEEEAIELLQNADILDENGEFDNRFFEKAIDSFSKVGNTIKDTVKDKIAFTVLWSMHGKEKMHKVVMFEGNKFKLVYNNRNDGFPQEAYIAIMAKDGTWKLVADSKELGFKMCPAYSGAQTIKADFENNFMKIAKSYIAAVYKEY